MSLPAITSAGTPPSPLVVDAGSDVSLSITLRTGSESGPVLDLLDATGGTIYVHEGWDERRTIDPALAGSYPVIIADASTGVLTITMTASETAALQQRLEARQRTVTDRNVMTYAYELEITDGTSVIRVLHGPLILSRRGARS